MKPLPYCVKNPTCIHQYLIIPKTHHRVALFFEPGISLSVFRDLVRQGMLTAIQFNNQLSFKAHKVDDILSNRVLASELHAFKSACP